MRLAAIKSNTLLANFGMAMGLIFPSIPVVYLKVVSFCSDMEVLHKDQSVACEGVRLYKNPPYISDVPGVMYGTVEGDHVIVVPYSQWYWPPRS